ncbi:DUF1877 family protein [uncultured Thiothrix sp.]|uniref:DUF1877 family protein n=1 Tax=uncultured Thiothrix sp. TaxID=223185 RepID=UPI002609BB10|nr:DUF1877 family protein [uncultured Thiothrix sp.]
MSLGGDFYALSDQQLEDLLDGALGLAFLYNELDERPRECYSGAEQAWYELTQILGSAMSDYSEQTDAIPEMSQYTWANDVPRLAAELAQMDEADIESRYNSDEMETDLATLKGYIQAVVSFYQRAAQKGDAVLFRVT